ncbi:MAG: tripartite tricarboxylate transporter substrate-binding protein [Comamonadaceae bacterium]|nr:tripartite tricarboxylate transporter substrate-binding protein [Comamonadaceae bacterium]
MKVLCTLIAILFCVGSGNVFADVFPNKPIRLVVPYAAGGTTDAMARVMQEPLQKILGEPIVIDNKPGAAGSIAARDVIRSAPDGYTLFFVNNGNLAVVPFVMKTAGYDGVKDFTSIALVSAAPMVVVVPGGLPVSNLREFINYAKSHPVSYATAGVGSFGHLSSVLFAKEAGISATQIPYKGQAPTMNATLSGEVQLLITTSSGTMNQQIAEKKLKILGVGSPVESPLQPGVPSVSSVLPGYVAESWFAIVGPANVPSEIVKKLNDAFSKVLESQDIKSKFENFGVIPQIASPEALREKTEAEIQRWHSVIKDNNINTD